MNDKGLIAPYLAFSLVNLFKTENASQFKLIKDLISIRMNDYLKNTSIPITVYSIMLISRDTYKSFIKDGDLLKTMTTFNFNVDHS